MKLLPSFEEFERGWAQGKNQLVYARLAADLDTPVSLMLKLAEARTDTFMLESVTGGEVRGRYSVVGMKPDLIWKCHGEAASINRDARFDPQAFTALPGHPLDSMRALIAESRVDLPDGLPAIASGLFGYLGYDMIRLVEHLPNVNPDPLGPARCRADAPLGRRGAGWRQGRSHPRRPGMGRLGPVRARRLCPSGRTGDGCPARS